jgi:NNP family nitrate/nitrite transporter-like MFS transporter
MVPSPADPDRWARRNTLLGSFLHFDFSFMLWVLVGALGIALAEAARLSPSEKALMVALPILAGSLLRLPVGMLVDRFGGKRVGVALLAWLFVPLGLAAQTEYSLATVLAIGAMLGAAGASFSVALPLASRWFPPERQGLAMGVAAAGNSGTVVTNLIAPRLVAAVGLHATFAVAMGALAVVLAAFAALAREPRRPAAPARIALPSFADPDLGLLCGFYAITFGGYVGLASFLPVFLRDAYAVTPIEAGLCTAGLAFLGSGARPIGGLIADRVGGARLLALLLVPIALAYAVESSLPPLPAMLATLALSMTCLGLGNGAVFQIVPQRFDRDLGVVTGTIGAIGGVGGFILPMLLGSAKALTHSFAAGFVVLAAVAALAALGLRLLVAPQGRWTAAA